MLVGISIIIIHVLQRCITFNQSKFIMRGHSINFFVMHQRPKGKWCFSFLCFGDMLKIGFLCFSTQIFVSKCK